MSMYVSVYVFVGFFLIAFSFLGLGLTVLISGKPLFLNWRYLFAWYVLGYSLAPVSLFSSSAREGSIALFVMTVLVTAAQGCVLVVLWKRTTGYFVLGLQRESFEEALRHGLKQQDLPSGEWRFDLRLPLGDDCLEITAPSRRGITQFKLTGSRDSVVLRRLAQDMKAFYHDHSTGANNVAAAFYVTLGTSLLILVGVGAYMVAS